MAGRMCWQRSRARYAVLRHISAPPFIADFCAIACRATDGGYAGPKPRDAISATCRWTVRRLKRSDTAEGFEITLRRRVVGRPLGWLGALSGFETKLLPGNGCPPLSNI